MEKLYNKEMTQSETLTFTFMLRGEKVNIKNRAFYYKDSRCFFVDWTVTKEHSYCENLSINDSNLYVVRHDTVILSAIADFMEECKTVEEFESAIQQYGFVEKNLY